MHEPQPCKCINNHAYTTPLHAGHCCFHPATQTCHQNEITQWETARAHRLNDVKDA